MNTYVRVMRRAGWYFTVCILIMVILPVLLTPEPYCPTMCEVIER